MFSHLGFGCFIIIFIYVINLFLTTGLIAALFKYILYLWLWYNRCTHVFILSFLFWEKCSLLFPIVSLWELSLSTAIRMDFADQFFKWMIVTQKATNFTEREWKLDFTQCFLGRKNSMHASIYVNVYTSRNSLTNENSKPWKCAIWFVLV